MSKDDEMKITPEAMAELNKLSLISFVTLKNGFTGLYMTAQLRIWHCEAEIRMTNHRIAFTGTEGRLPVNICDAISRTFLEVQAYIKEHPDLQDYWDEIG